MLDPKSCLIPDPETFGDLIKRFSTFNFTLVGLKLDPIYLHYNVFTLGILSNYFGCDDEYR